MRIAISGAHQTGKTTLVETLQSALPTYYTSPEPYYLMEEEGYEFSHPPSREDFEIQLQRSLKAIGESEEDQFFDRCPADFLAYLLTDVEAGSPEYRDWWSLVQDSMEWFDLIVYVPIQDPDRMNAANMDYPELRLNVDRILRDIVLRDTWDEFGVEMLEVSGSTQECAGQVLEWIKSHTRMDT